MTSEYPEPPLPDQVELGYPTAIRSLQSPLDALAYDFAANREPSSSTDSLDYDAASSFRSTNGSTFDSGFDSRQVTPASDSLSAEVLGPPPAISKRDFKLPDSDHDAFLQIGEIASQFDRHNQRLRRSSEHRLLYHAVWRQPVLNRVQAEAVLISGGDRYDEHHELEGSVMLSFNVNRIDVDARLWVATFRQGREPHQINRFEDNRRSNRAALADREEQGLWGLRSQRELADTAVFSLPPVPNTSASISGTSEPSFDSFAQSLSERRSVSASSPSRVESYRVIELGYMAQRRSMVSNQLHYLDHPNFGVLIELRPYQLPDSLSMDSQLD